MANQKKKAEAVKTTPAFRGYVKQEIRTQEELDSFHVYEHKIAPDFLWKQYSDLVDDGYKVTFKIDGKGFKAELFNVSAEESAHGYILSGYGNSLEKAATAVLYKHHELMQGDWTDYLTVEEVEVR